MARKLVKGEGGTPLTPQEALQASMDCPGGEAHEEHLALNGECPWCDVCDAAVLGKLWDGEEE